MKPETMIDIETLSSKPDAAVIAIGICLFDEVEVLESAEILIDPRLAPGRRDKSTLAWWNSQDPEVFRKMMSGTEPPWEACHYLAEIIEDWNAKVMWANPPTFDISIMRHLYEVVDIPFPIHFTGERDFRTLRKIADLHKVDYREPYAQRTAHDAESDAVCQAHALQIILRDLALF